jgi:hypothetical protein
MDTLDDIAVQAQAVWPCEGTAVEDEIGKRSRSELQDRILGRDRYVAAARGVTEVDDMFAAVK